jgi:glc operon protein GlcG
MGRYSRSPIRMSQVVTSGSRQTASSRSSQQKTKKPPRDTPTCGYVAVESCFRAIHTRRLARCGWRGALVGALPPQPRPDLEREQVLVERSEDIGDDADREVGLTLERARQAVALAIGRAREIDARVTVAVVDAGGHIVVVERMDGAGFASPEIARGKAWTAAAFGAPSSELAERFATAPAFATAVSVTTDGRFTPRAGGLPFAGGGAIGVSGGTPTEDEDIAEAGRKAIADSRGSYSTHAESAPP